MVCKRKDEGSLAHTLTLTLALQERNKKMEDHMRDRRNSPFRENGRSDSVTDMRMLDRGGVTMNRKKRNTTKNWPEKPSEKPRKTTKAEAKARERDGDRAPHI